MVLKLAVSVLFFILVKECVDAKNIIVKRDSNKNESAPSSASSSSSSSSSSEEANEDNARHHLIPMSREDNGNVSDRTNHLNHPYTDSRKEKMKKLFDEMSMEKENITSASTEDESMTNNANSIQTLILPLVSRDVEHVSQQNNLYSDESEESDEDVLIESETISPVGFSFPYMMSINFEFTQVIIYVLIFLLMVYLFKRLHHYVKKSQQPIGPITKNPVVAMEQANVRNASST